MSASDLAKNMGAICHSFNKNSRLYAKNCALQSEVAKNLLSFCEVEKYRKIIDLGAGSGNVALNLSQILGKSGICVNNFIALDSSPNMLSLHPKKLPHIAQIRLIECDFEKYNFSDDFDLILSSSALQWAKDLDSFFKKMRVAFERESSADSCESKYSPALAEGARGRVDSRESKIVSQDFCESKKFAFAIFTAESLRELHAFLGTKSPLKSATEILSIAQKYFCVESKIARFTRTFSTRKELLGYLKNSALLGGGNIAFKDKKRLKCAFPHKMLNFEVLFIKNQTETTQ